MNQQSKQKLNQLISNPAFHFGMLYIGSIFITALVGPFLIDFDSTQVDLMKRTCQPSKINLLGCDLYGRDVVGVLITGARITLYISIAAVSCSTFLGTILGLISGYFGGFWDKLIMRVVDTLMAFPGILLTLALTSLLGPSVNNIIYAIIATGWTSFARLARAQVLSVKESEFITASHLIGASPTRVILKHILPSIVPTIIITATFSLSGVILVEASLSFLGLGSEDQTPSWGNLLNQGKSVLLEAPHLSIAPGLLIAFLVLSFNLVGDAIKDTWDPKMKKSGNV